MVALILGLSACTTAQDPSDNLRVAGATTSVVGSGSEMGQRRAAILIHLENGQQYNVEEGETFDLHGSEYVVKLVSPTGVVLSAAGRSYRIPPIGEGAGQD